MPFHRTDKGKIVWPKGISSENRRFCRLIYQKIAKNLVTVLNKPLVVACSGGLDSTVLSHALAKTLLLSGNKQAVILCYINHNLRPSAETIGQDYAHVYDLANRLDFEPMYCSVQIGAGNTQALAREARYDALCKIATERKAVVLMAHHANDVAETKLWQFITGREAKGISKEITRIQDDGTTIFFYRPLLDFTREDLERYAKVWNLLWSEDSSNATNKYARNRIRHELIPWIESNLNSGLIKTLTGSNGFK